MSTNATPIVSLLYDSTWNQCFNVMQTVTGNYELEDTVSLLKHIDRQDGNVSVSSSGPLYNGFEIGSQITLFFNLKINLSFDGIIRFRRVQCR